MAVIKWVLIVAGGLFIVSIAGCLGVAGYLGSAEAEAMSVRDLEPGGDFSPGEREAFIKSCEKGLSKPGTSSQTTRLCECIANHGDHLSRFERLAMEV